MKRGGVASAVARSLSALRAASSDSSEFARSRNAATRRAIATAPARAPTRGMDRGDHGDGGKPSYVAFRTHPPRGLRALFARRRPSEILLVDGGGEAIALYEDDRARAFPSFAALLRAHAIRGDELEFRGLGR